MTDLNELAEMLWRAQETTTACEPVIVRAPDLTVEQAYEVQRINLERHDSSLVGRKIGLTSAALQTMLGITEPDFGGLLATMQVPAGGVIDTSGMLQPRAEAEIAFVLADDLDAEHITTADVISATSYILPAIEVIDSRVADWKISYRDTIADNASSGMFVLGSEPVSLIDNELELAGMVLRKNNRVVSTGAGIACMDHPVNAVTWLANTLAGLGTPLRAGDIVLSGALGPVTPVVSGDVLDAQISRVGRVRVRFA